MSSSVGTPARASSGSAATWLVVAALLPAACGQPVLLEELAPEADCRRVFLVGPRVAKTDTAVPDRLTVRWILPDQVEQVHQLNAWCAAVGPALVGGWATPIVAPRTTPATDASAGDDPAAERPPPPPPPPPSDTAAGATPVPPADAAADRGDEPAAVPDPEADPGEERGPATPPRPVVDSVAVVAWNVHVGGGQLRRLVQDLRRGTLTDGGPVEHFVLLLQETYRAGPAVPPLDADLPGGSGIVSAPPGGGARADIVAHAEELGLDLFYAPSMRNGEGEDRGNAILSTLPLHDLATISLPVARQRRVVLAASLLGATSAGEEWRLQVASVHLESDAAGIGSDEAARMIQTEALLDVLPESDAAVAAGDFNTRLRGRDSDLVRVMLDAYPDTPPFPAGPTYRRAWGLYRLYLDYIFFRLPDNARARYRRVPDLYASDHYPLVGWVVFARPDS